MSLHPIRRYTLLLTALVLAALACNALTVAPRDVPASTPIATTPLLPEATPTPAAPAAHTQGSPEAAVVTGTAEPAAGLCTSADLNLVDTPKGNYLQMCVDGQPFEIGPLENGGYALGPNGKFFVYCANSGPCYAARLGQTRLTPIGNVKSFSIIRRGEAPVYYFEFYGDNPYTVQVFEDILKQNETLSIPHYLTADE